MAEIDLKELFNFSNPQRRKFLLAGLAVGGGVGLIVYLQKRGSTDSGFSATPTGLTEQTGDAGAGGYADAGGDIPVDSSLVDQLLSALSDQTAILQDTLVSGFETGYANQQVLYDELGAVASLLYASGGGEVYYTPSVPAEYAPSYAAYQPTAGDLGGGYAGTFETPDVQAAQPTGLADALFKTAAFSAPSTSTPAKTPSNTIAGSFASIANQPVVKTVQALVGGKTAATPTPAAPITGYQAAGVLGSKPAAVIQSQPKSVIASFAPVTQKQPVYTPVSSASRLSAVVAGMTASKAAPVTVPASGTLGVKQDSGKSTVPLKKGK